MRRREFITLLGGAATWPIAARAQQPEGTRRVGILVPGGADDPRYQRWIKAFVQELAAIGWAVGTNLQIDARFGTDNPDEIRKHARDWSLFNRMSSSHMVPRPCVRCCKQVGPYRSFSR